MSITIDNNDNYDDDNGASEETVAIYSAPDRISADLLISLLASEGIRAVIGEQVTSMYAGALAVGEGYAAEVRVDREAVPRAQAIVEAFVAQPAGSDSLTDEELNAAAEESYDPNV